jgi:purine-nucleoside phosphorylase
MIHQVGGHVVGMSTVPEVIVARARGLRCMAISLVTNMATGLASGPQAHEDVMEVGRRAGLALGRVLEGFVALLPQDASVK